MSEIKDKNFKIKLSKNIIVFITVPIKTSKLFVSQSYIAIFQKKSNKRKYNDLFLFWLAIAPLI